MLAARYQLNSCLLDPDKIDESRKIVSRAFFEKSGECGSGHVHLPRNTILPKVFRKIRVDVLNNFVDSPQYHEVK